MTLDFVSRRSSCKVDNIAARSRLIIALKLIMDQGFNYPVIFFVDNFKSID